ncbi:helicase [Paraphotobacterium marinum]|uniref:Helicase n=1 Tax=Paraphotobacterium marinum TaxID=1755811 RepID=A0A220VFE1_9GAMM|nr:helicase-related protein [Paraphotobacterium marinum]ASK79128.1 helicase [Paraphotobacterium marinum]
MIIDNVTKTVSETIKNSIEENDQVSIMSGFFSIYAFEHLKDEFKKLDSVRLLFSKAIVFSLPNHCENLPFGMLNGSIFENKFRNKLNQKSIANDFADWIKHKTSIKLATQPGIINQHIIHIKSSYQPESISIDGAQFNGQGLGLTESDTFDLISISKDEKAHDLLNFFNRVWNSKNKVIEAKNELLYEINQLTMNRTPYFIYLFILYNLFKDHSESIIEENIIKVKTGFKNTIVWNKLYHFQKDGVIGAIDKLEKYNGCIIADSVGLGKTFEALAVIKYFELRNDKVLVLCPKKLRDNWLIYTQNDKRNLLVNDRFNYDVLNHTDMSRSSGFSGNLNLETINWGNYDLIVIDESHNFRNNNPKPDKRNRYQRLLEDIIQSGVKTKVLMLSATPVNNRLNDIKNQIAFITEANDQALINDGINSIEQTLRQAQLRFSRWSEQDPNIRTSKSLLESMNFDYFKLLDIYTIARSRKHIEKYYGTEDIGNFPTRLLPINLKPSIDIKNKFPSLEEVNKTIRRLTLAFYSPMKYIRMDKKDEYARRYDRKVKGGKSIFKQIDREESLINLIRINLLKRMESSIHSFTITTEKLLVHVENLLSKIKEYQYKKESISTNSSIEEFAIPSIEDIQDFEFEAPEISPFLIGNKTKVKIEDIDIIRIVQDLQSDKLFLSEIVNSAKNIDTERDAKLDLLKQTYLKKYNNPFNNNNKKVIIFTAFADTADYLYNNLSEWALTELGIYAAIVTGQRTDSTLLDTNRNKVQTDLNTLLTHFSPYSKEREKIYPDFKKEIDILIATDCISEGQNLQDCDYLINYDIHWNPVRIIQRFGRIDRLGSKNNTVQLVNFWPNMELDEYINLEARVSGRMVLLDISATGEENIIEHSPKDNKEMNDLEYRKKQLEQLQNSVVDLEDISGGISITDLTLNDFRMDLSGVLSDDSKNNVDPLMKAPLGLFSPVIINKEFFKSNLREFTSTNEEIKPGVIFFLKDIQGKVPSHENYPLAPYYLIYISDDEEIILSYSQSKQILDLCKKLGTELKDIQYSKQAYHEFDRQTNKGKCMTHYQNLLSKAIDEVWGKSTEIGTSSLFKRGGTSIKSSLSHKVNDFEVVCYIVILKESHDG